MARYTGPTTKKSRSFGESIFGYDKYFERRKYPPGQHGLTRKKKAGSNYAQQLSEKQKAKYTYGFNCSKRGWTTPCSALASRPPAVVHVSW
jgi:small subunit ribosomal protein S4